MKKQYIGWLFAVIVLSCLLVISVILGLTGYYFSVSYLYSNSQLVVGDQVTVTVEPNQSNVVSFTFDGSFLPNETIPQVVQISATDLNSDCNVRVKAKVFGVKNKIEFDFVTTEHFEKAPDGYYYYDGVLNGGNKITFCNYLIMPKSEDFVSKEKYILTLVVETLESKYDVENIWKNVQQT
ncbi:MAG: hypothetical protein ACI4R8_02945 [Candidatus Caccovivens sp.]